MNFVSSLFYATVCLFSFCLSVRFVLNSLCFHSYTKWRMGVVSVLCETRECGGGRYIPGGRGV